MSSVELQSFRHRTWPMSLCPDATGSISVGEHDKIKIFMLKSHHQSSPVLDILLLQDLSSWLTENERSLEAKQSAMISPPLCLEEAMTHLRLCQDSWQEILNAEEQTQQEIVRSRQASSPITSKSLHLVLQSMKPDCRKHYGFLICL